MANSRITALHRKILSDFGIEEIDTEGISIKNYKKGEFIFEQGSPLDSLILVTEGRIKVCNLASNGKTLVFCYNDPGAMLGEVEFMTQAFAASSVCAVTDAECIAIPFERYRDYLSSNITFMNRVCLVLAEIVAQNSINNASNILYPFEARLCAYIAMASENGYFNEKLTELAELLGTSYRHLLRTIENLSKKGVIEKMPQGYMIKDERKLRTIGINFYSR